MRIGKKWSRCATCGRARYACRNSGCAPRAEKPLGIVARVNARLREMGREERLRRGRGYFYFYDGGAESWYSSSIPVFSLDHWTVDEVIAEMLRLEAVER